MTVDETLASTRDARDVCARPNVSTPRRGDARHEAVWQHRDVTDLNRAQRVVLVVAAGVALLAIGQWLSSVVTSRSFVTGWTGYAPLQSVVTTSRWQRGELLLLWLGLVVLWTFVALVLLRTRDRASTTARGRGVADRHDDADT